VHSCRRLYDSLIYLYFDTLLQVPLADSTLQQVTMPQDVVQPVSPIAGPFPLTAPCVRHYPIPTRLLSSNDHFFRKNALYSINKSPN